MVWYLLILFTILYVPTSYAGPGDPATAAKAWPLIADGALLIDVRTSDEFVDGHIDGAVNIPFDQTKTLVGIIGKDKSRPVVLYCQSGNRSGKATKTLEALGYTAIYNATGYQALVQTKP